jgi:cell cycle arrest protein BUB3
MQGTERQRRVQTLRLYDTFANAVRTTFAHPAGVLDACFTDGSHAASGGLDHQVRYYDLNAGHESLLGAHDQAVRATVCSAELGVVYSGSWDSTVRVWDPRAPSGKSQVRDRRLPAATDGGARW